MLEPEKQKIIQCLHCGNKTLMNQKGEYKFDWYEHGYHGYWSYKLYQCPICKKPTLHETYWDCEKEPELQQDGDYTVEDEKILYPINTITEQGIPSNIKSAFEAALKIKNIDNASCLMSIRRTLELILQDKGATKWGLKGKINELATKEVLPDPLKIASSFAKKLGDSAAHNNEFFSKITTQDVVSIIEFVEHIIDYLYILPWKINKFQEKHNLKDSSTNAKT